MIRKTIALTALFALTVAGAALAADTPPVFNTKWGSFGSGDGEFDGSRGVATDSEGNVYVTDGGNHRIQKFNSAGAFLAMWGWGVNTGAAQLEVCTPETLPCQAGIFGSGDGQFLFPGAGVATDSHDNVYVADLNNHRIQKFNSTGAFLIKWGSFGSGDGQFILPRDVATDSEGNVYVTDSGNHRIQKFGSAGGYVTEWGSNGTGEGEFDGLRGVATDSEGNVYVTDSGNHRIQKFGSAGGYVTEWGSSGTGDGQFDSPSGVAIDSHGNIYVADTFNQRIQKFDSAGAFLAMWGWGVNTGAAQLEVCTPATLPCQAGIFGSGDGQFLFPFFVAIDSHDNVYVADTSNNRIQKFVPAPTGDPEGECAGSEGVELDAQLTDGLDPVAADESATWTVELTATACEDVLDVSAQGGTPAWANTDATTDDGDIAVRKQNAKSEVLLWDIGALSAGEVATATLDVSGTTGKKAKCASLVQLSGDWSVTATADEPDAIATKYDHADKVSVTIGGDAC